ncbi:hypothetical protein AGMMS49944_10440 [Spirochaetia bacterium]|nr:hypothetical protein AGMMS49944_10440 [Spirochaetia bacterium]
MIVILGIVLVIVVLVVLGVFVLKSGKDAPTQKPGNEQGENPMERLQDRLRALIEEFTTVELLSYADAMKYFIGHKSDNNSIAKGAMLKEIEDENYYLTQVFLDKDNNLVCMDSGKPLGRKIKVTRFDDELLGVFKTKDLVIVE